MSQTCIAFRFPMARQICSFRRTRMKQTRIVITGVGLTAPNGNSLPEFRKNLLNGVSGITEIDVRYMSRHPAGMCTFDTLKYQTQKDVRIGTRAGGNIIYFPPDALASNRP